MRGEDYQGTGQGRPGWHGKELELDPQSTADMAKHVKYETSCSDLSFRRNYLGCKVCIGFETG